MKKVLCFVLTAIMVIMAGCSIEYKKSSPQEILSEYLANIEQVQVPMREFGELTSYVDMTETMVVGILYPETGCQVLNEAINSWILETVKFYRTEYVENKKVSEPAELTVDYESFCVAESYVGVKMKGVFMSSNLAHPIDVYKTFNVNIKEGKLLTAKDIFTADGLNAFRKKIVETAGIETERVNENITDYLVLEKGGLEII